jgi:hypothetical protein
MSADREKLAKQEREVLAQIAAPADERPATLRQAAQTLTNKRRRELMIAAPVLAEQLGSKFEELFAEYAPRNGYPHRGGPVADAAQFAVFLNQRGEFPANAAREGGWLVGWQGSPLKICRLGGRVFAVMRLKGRVRVVRLFSLRIGGG